jgi:hypothetical protein
VRLENRTEMVALILNIKQTLSLERGESPKDESTLRLKRRKIALKTDPISTEQKEFIFKEFN